jgi:sigma-B regulation protein RsbU (phosphoserine phosphatase)
MALLLRVDPKGAESFTYLCEGSSVVIGRSKTADLTLPGSDPYVSRRHARLFREGDKWFIEDLGSRNTTRLNDQEVLEAEEVGSGDRIRISDCFIHVESQEDAAAAGETLDAPAEVFRSAAQVISGMHTQETPRVEGEEVSRRYTARLKTLNQVHQALASSVTRDDLLELVLDRAFAHLRPEEAVIYLKDAAGDYYPAASRQLPDLKGDLVFSDRLIRSVSERGLAALIADVLLDKTWADARSLVNAGVRSLVAAPLAPSGGEPGMIVLTSRSHVRRFSEEDRELLVSLASVAALRLGNIALHEEAARRRELDKELGLAREIQDSLLPAVLPDLSAYELFAKNAASRTISGDMYQVFERVRTCVAHRRRLREGCPGIPGLGITRGSRCGYRGDGAAPRGDLREDLATPLRADAP